MPEDVDTFLRHFAPRCHVCAKIATRMHVPETGHTFWKAEVGVFRIILGIPSVFSTTEIRNTFLKYFGGLSGELAPYLKEELIITPWVPSMGPFLCDEHTVLKSRVVELDYAHLVRGAEEPIERPTRFERILSSDA